MPSIGNFVRYAKHPLLGLFLQQRGIDLDEEELSGEAKAIAARIETALQELPPGSRSRFDHELEKIDALSKGLGQLAVENVFPGEEALRLPAGLNRALWLYLHDGTKFRQAEEILYNDGRRGTRRWQRFRVEAGRTLRQDQPSLDAFSQRLKRQFDTENVHLDIFQRGLPGAHGLTDPSIDDEKEDQSEAGRIWQVTIYREGAPCDDLRFEDNVLKADVRRQVIEASFTYDPSTGDIECLAGDRDSRQEIVATAAVELLDCSADTEPLELRSYDLTVLRERIPFDTDPQDRIDSVRVTRMLLSPTETQTERVILESRRDGPDMWTMAAARLGTASLVSEYAIDQAELCIRYRNGESNRLRTLRILITHPSSSNIKEHTTFEEMISQKYLPRWGLAST